MARRPNTPSPPTLPLTLAHPRADVARRLRERIELGRQMQARPLHRGEDVEAFKNAVDRWDEFNVELLKKQFNIETISDEYNYSNVGFVGNINDPPEITTYRLYKETLDSRLNKLESIFERLELYPEPTSTSSTTIVATPKRDLSKVFVVHGHDVGAHQAMARFLEKIELEAVILQEQPNQGLTIMEKFELHASHVGFAVVLLTPDDFGGAAAAPNWAARARQNVIFELGYFAGKLGRGRTCLLRKGDVEIPSDLYGVIYTEMDAADGWKLKLAKELKSAGLKFDGDKVF